MGEAAVPGPVCSEVTFCVINPTTVADKVVDIVDINASVILAAETAATLQVQKGANPQFRGRGYTAHWGSPVPERYHPSTGRPSRRQTALGTAIFSQLPSRGPVTALSPEMYSSCRISEAFVRLPTAEIRLLAAYGVPSCLPQASERNNLLLTWLFERATASSLPCLIAGDFNTLPSALPAWRNFAALGWSELGEFAQQALGVDLPNTCKEATRFDTFLLSPHHLIVTPPCTSRFVCRVSPNCLGFGGFPVPGLPWLRIHCRFRLHTRTAIDRPRIPSQATLL